MADEFSRIDELLRRLRQHAAHVEVPNGDDAAVLRWPADATVALNGERVVLSVDAAVDDVHFRRAWLSFEALGYRSAIVALSDLAAMGAQPRAMLTSLIAPADLDDASLYAIADGYARAARSHDAPVVGGNMSRGDALSLTTTVIGALDAPALLRSGARVGDAIYVTGTLGAAALGLCCLQREHHDAMSAAFIARWRQPIVRIAEGIALRAHAHAAIDVSDGLLQDLAHVCRASGVGAAIDVDALPLAPHATSLALALSLDAHELALIGGEDYELLFTLPDDISPPFSASRIGQVIAGASIQLTQGGVARPLPQRAGYKHFE